MAGRPDLACYGLQGTMAFNVLWPSMLWPSMYGLENVYNNVKPGVMFLACTS